MLNSVSFTSGENTTVAVVQRQRLPIKGIECWRTGEVLHDYWPYFYCTCAELAILDLPVKNLTSPFASATSIIYIIYNYFYHYR